MTENTETQTASSTQALSTLQAKQKAPPPSVQTRYVDHCTKDPDLASDGIAYYRWKGDHWSMQSSETSRKEAMHFLYSYAPHRLSESTADSCMATAMRFVPALPERLNRGVIVPVKGAWLELKNGQWIATPPDRQFGVTHRIALKRHIALGKFEPQPVPEGSLFHRFLTTSMPDVEVRDALQEFVGSTLCSRVMSVAAFWLGHGGNGKSCMINIVRALHERTAVLELDKLDGFGLVPIVGASLAISDEQPDRPMRQQKLKSLISGGAVQVRDLYKSAQMVKPTAKFIVSLNSMPTFRDNTNGWWRRIHVFNWDVQISANDIIPNFEELIIDQELDIVLDWALEGLTRVAARNFKPAQNLPTSMLKAHATALSNSDSVTDWRDSCGVAQTLGKYMSKTELFDHYVDFCEKARIPHLSNSGKFFERVHAIFSGLNEDRPTINKVRVRRVDLGLGIFPPAPPATTPSQTTAPVMTPVATSAPQVSASGSQSSQAIVMSQPIAASSTATEGQDDDDDFDPFEELFKVPLDKGAKSAIYKV